MGVESFASNRVAEFVLAFLFAILVINFYAVTELPLTALNVLQDLGSAMASTPDGFKNLVQGTYWLALWHNTTPAIWVMLAHFTLGSLETAAQPEDERSTFALDPTHLFPVAFVCAIRRPAFFAGHWVHLRVCGGWSCLDGGTHLGCCW